MIQSAKWVRYPWFFSLIGLLSMIPVLWIARTSMFYLCYFPLIIAAVLVSCAGNPNQVKLPSLLIRLFSFLSGMIICSMLFSLILVAQGEISFNFQSAREDWTILGIELLLGLIVFTLFFGIAVFFRFLLRKLKK